MFKQVPTFDNGKWTVTDFKTRESFTEFVFSIFKEPGLYEFNKTSSLI